MKELKKHKAYYFFLIAILILGFFAVYSSAPNVKLQSIYVVMTGFFYFILGVVHHVQNHDFHPKIVIEYALIASLGIACILFMLKVGLGA